jgi:ubiquinone/menaquinone biosynthesis C-methylase UbiE
MTKIKNQNSDFIRHNRRIHDRVASKYDKTHSEIFNPVEQERIRDCLKYSISQIGTGASIFKTLDFGAGTGNLTRHCIGMNLDVTAADVSEKSLEIIKEKYPENDNLTVELLNGVDLSNFKSDTFDLIVTYSVLHHVPEYLAIIEEFVRVLKPNGIIYLDHERTPSFWNRSSLVYKEYENEMIVNYGETKIERLN